VLLFQIHDHIAREILHQDPHATNYYGHKEVGDFLKTILKPGATRDWRELTREATGSDLSAQADAALLRSAHEVSAGREQGAQVHAARFVSLAHRNACHTKGPPQRRALFFARIEHDASLHQARRSDRATHGSALGAGRSAHARRSARRGALPARVSRAATAAFIHFGNCHEFFAELLAIWSLGACAVPIDPRFTPFEIETLAAWSKPKTSSWLETPDGTLSVSLEKLGVRVIEIPRGIVPPLRGGVPLSRGFVLDDDALILFTSGTTGQPKGVVHTHRSLRARWMALRDNLGIDAYARTLCMLPTHFGHGLICNALFPWLSGCDLYIMPPFRPKPSPVSARSLTRIELLSCLRYLHCGGWRCASQNHPKRTRYRACSSAQHRSPPRCGTTSSRGRARHVS
jgi:hypothetical protein